MNRTVLAAAVALVLGSTLYVAAQQPGAPPAGAPAGAPPGGRRAAALPVADLKTG